MTIPLYCVDKHNELNVEIKIPHWIYSKTTFTRADVNHGYFVIWRDRDKKDPNGYLRDQELIFVPSENETIIPIDSSHEEIMLKHLVSLKKKFKKPLIIAAGETYLPDFILVDQNPHMFVEVAGLETDEYKNHLKIKEEHYRSKGYEYIEWNTREEIPSIHR